MGRHFIIIKNIFGLKESFAGMVLRLPKMKTKFYVYLKFLNKTHAEILGLQNDMYTHS